MSDKHKNTNTSDQAQHEFGIQRIYTKDLSYESPGSPEIFQAEWTPQIDVNLHTDSKKLSDELYEVVLQVTATVKIQDKTAFLVEVKQAGVFIVKNFNSEQIGPMLGSFCPNILFPYVRELISETVCRGGFPPLYLSPINFDAFYHEKLKQQTTAS